MDKITAKISTCRGSLVLEFGIVTPEELALILQKLKCKTDFTPLARKLLTNK